METNNQKNDQNIIPNDADKPQKGVNVPNLRFGEFDYKWEREKLENCASIYDGTHQTPNYTKSGIRFISVENISNLYNSQKFISLDDFKKECICGKKHETGRFISSGRCAQERTLPHLKRDGMRM